MINMLKLMIGKLLYGRGYTPLPLPTPQGVTPPALQQSGPTSYQQLPTGRTANRICEPVPVNLWLDETLLKMTHLMISGSTGNGKTQIARALQHVAVKHGYKCFMISPKVQYGLDCNGVGYGGNFAAIEQAYDHFIALMNTRYQQFAYGKEDFEPILLCIDEIPALVDGCSKDKTANFIKTMANLARSANIKLCIMSQSPLVRDIQISSASKQNFSKITVGQFARDDMPNYFLPNEQWVAAFNHQEQRAALSLQGIMEIARQPLPRHGHYQIKRLAEHNPELIAQKKREIEIACQPKSRATTTTGLDFIFGFEDEDESNFGYVPEQTDPQMSITLPASKLLTQTEQAMRAYQTGAKTERALAAALDLSNGKAHQLMLLVKKELGVNV